LNFQLSYHLDLFAVFIFLGIVQGVFLCFFFFSKENRVMPSNVFHGIMLISITACILEIFLMYTGYIVHCFYFVDFSEPISFLIGPAFYLMVLSHIHGQVSRKQYWHFLPAFLYLLIHLPFLFRGEVVKYNAWIYSYHPDLTPRDPGPAGDGRNLINNHATQLALIHLSIYAVLGFIQVIKAFRARNESLLRPNNPVLKKLRYGLFEILFVSAMVVVVKIFKKHDTGDHLFATYIAFSIYITSFSVMRNSGFFRQAVLTDSNSRKYKNAVAPELHDHTLKKLQDLLSKEKMYCNPDFSLPMLAQELGVSVHALSQIINEGLGKNFFEMAASYRVEEAKRLLIDQPNIKVEEIAEQVGYMSKSSFNTAFKKITGQTPSEFRQGAVARSR
jgi:AraC-like DNA-binding protein